MGKLYSGEYEILNQKRNYDELATTIQLHIVTWEGNTDNCGNANIKTFEFFEQELKELLEKYAI